MALGCTATGERWKEGCNSSDGGCFSSPVHKEFRQQLRYSHEMEGWEAKIAGNVEIWPENSSILTRESGEFLAGTEEEAGFASPTGEIVNRWEEETQRCSPEGRSAAVRHLRLVARTWTAGQRREEWKNNGAIGFWKSLNRQREGRNQKKTQPKEISKHSTVHACFTI